MKKKLIAFILLIGSFANLSAQKLELKWSDPIKVGGQKDLVFKDYVGVNSKNYYGIFSDLRLRSKRISKLQLVAYDKSTDKQVAEVKVFGFKENKPNKDKYRGLLYDNTLVYDDIIYIFYTKETKEIEEVYCETFSSTLTKLSEVKLVYGIPQRKKGLFSSNKKVHEVLSNPKIADKIVIGGELPSKKGENYRFEYRVLNRDLSFSASKTVTLSYVNNGDDLNTGETRYRLGADGNIYISTVVRLPKEERKLLKKGESSRFGTLTLINPANGNLKVFNLKYANKNIVDFGYLADGTSFRVFGFYNDLNQKKGSIHGIFYSTLNPDDFSVIKSNFADFEPKLVKKLFQNDKEDANKKGFLGLGGKDDESISIQYNIENAFSMDNGDIVLISTIMHNYTVQQCTQNSNGTQSCRNIPYCEKKNVTVFSINKEGQINWGNNFDRSFTYAGRWNVEDVRSIYNNGNFYVIYNNDYTGEKNKFGKKKTKGYREGRDNFEYLVVDNKSGNMKQNKYTINTNEDKIKKEVNPVAIATFPNSDNFYVASSVYQNYNARYCCAGLTCGILLSMKNVYKGYFYSGVISPR